MDQLAAAGNPILLLDTCALLDIIRMPVRDTFQTNDATAVPSVLARVEATAPTLSIVVDEQVELEFNDHVVEVEAETLRELRKATDIARGMLTRMSRLSGATHSSMVDLAAQGFPAAGRTLADRFLVRALVLEDHQDEKARAFKRVSFAIPPATRAKPSPKDCLITETYLRLAIELRAAGFTAPVVFFTSNVNDYCKAGGRRLLETIEDDFNVARLDFASRWAAIPHAV